MPKSHLTPVQELYLESFDRFLRADNGAERAFHRSEMSERLNFILAEVGLELPEDTRWEAPDSLLERSPQRDPSVSPTSRS